MKKDMKEALSSGRKPDTTHIRTPLKVYGSRACEYGDKTQDGKYERSNYLRPVGGVKEDFLRFRAYLRAAVSHGEKILDSMELHQAMDPNLENEEGMKSAAYARDDDAAPGCPVGPSLLPHICGMIASVNMAVTQAVVYGLLPEDPGQPWRAEKADEPRIDEMKVYWPRDGAQPPEKLDAPWCFYAEDSEHISCNAYVAKCSDVWVVEGNFVTLHKGSVVRRVW